MAQYRYSYDVENPRAQNIVQDKFNEWTKDNMYRSSYGNHWTNKPQEPKNVVYQGYAGYIPGSLSENQHGKAYSPISRDCFDNPKLGKNVFGLSTSGFNLKRTDHIDQSLTGSCHKQGMSSIQKYHPAWHVKKWESTVQNSFRDPKSLNQPTYRETDKFLQTLKKETKDSGFVQNHTYFDGTGWVPEKVLHGNLEKTEYRLRFNPDVPFHRDTNIFKIRKLPKKEYTYKYML